MSCRSGLFKQPAYAPRAGFAGTACRHSVRKWPLQPAAVAAGGQGGRQDQRADSLGRHNCQWNVHAVCSVLLAGVGGELLQLAWSLSWAAQPRFAAAMPCRILVSSQRKPVTYLNPCKASQLCCQFVGLLASRFSAHLTAGLPVLVLQRYLQEHGAVHLSALGIAISSAVTVAEILKGRQASRLAAAAPCVPSTPCDSARQHFSSPSHSMRHTTPCRNLADVTKVATSLETLPPSDSAKYVGVACWFSKLLVPASHSDNHGIPPRNMTR